MSTITENTKLPLSLVFSLLGAGLGGAVWATTEHFQAQDTEKRVTSIEIQQGALVVKMEHEREQTRKDIADIERKFGIIEAHLSYIRQQYERGVK